LVRDDGSAPRRLPIEIRALEQAGADVNFLLTLAQL
jgi:hypothetical protein